MSKKTKIACDDIWKLYGSNPREFFERHKRNPDDEAIRSEKYIPAVRGATFDVYEGEILVIMGLSGSGKSTLVRCLSRLIEPTWGKVEFDGIDLLQASEKELIDIRRHKMGMVFQHFALLPHRTVIQNIAFPLEVQGIDKDTREKKAREIIEIVGLQGRDNYYPRELSGGQQQRVGIGRSLAVEPDIWFLDEPFSALDPLIRKEMQDEFIRLQSMLGKTIVFITHDFDEAIKLADRIAIMYEGMIVQLGTAEELISNPATDYVAEFTRDIPRAKLLSVRSIMDPPPPVPAADRLSVHADESVQKIARDVLAQELDANVVDDRDEIVGTLQRQRLLNALFEQ
ncbi:MAG: betaine/proline/choline family ABC transporter ATP-binding protein [Gammaproteobacteria bacterium]|nr:betaine/proline/choline family ABC transporter ATP-binding protein [Gammaproteobacteria bacterium]MYD75386.1 betaine/proline/choline family ABC transporter ATP-binding protein [Gammaproteobacteria bacterium]